MVTLTGTVRPPSIWKLKEFTELYSGVHNLRLGPEDRRLLVRALTNVLLLHWPGLNEQVCGKGQIGQSLNKRETHLLNLLRSRVFSNHCFELLLLKPLHSLKMASEVKYEVKFEICYLNNLIVFELFVPIFQHER